jgi:hypothetical protein
MSNSETLYDQITQRLKNNKVVVLILIAFAVVLGVAQFQGALTGIIGTVRAPQVQVQASIQPYDFMGGQAASLKGLTPIQGDSDHIEKMAVALSEEIVSALGVTPTTVEATLQIDGHSLHSSQPLRASVLVLASPIAQVGRVAKDLGEANGLDVLPLFGDSQFVNHNDNSLDMELVPQHGYFQRESLKIFRGNPDFSFEPNGKQLTKVIRFTPHKPKLMLAFDTTGPQLENARASLEFMLRSELQKRSLELSSLTQAELEEQRKTIQNLGMGAAKTQLTDKFNVDYIVKATLLSE